VSGPRCSNEGCPNPPAFLCSDDGQPERERPLCRKCSPEHEAAGHVLRRWRPKGGV
jgi:hypothetical protein